MKGTQHIFRLIGVGLIGGFMGYQFGVVGIMGSIGIVFVAASLDE